MINTNSYISKTNLIEKVSDSIASMVDNVNLMFEKSTKIAKQQSPTVIINFDDYYAKVSNELVHNIDIDREFNAQGNVW